MIRVRFAPISNNTMALALGWKAHPQTVDRSYRFSMTTPRDHPTNPLHGVTLERMLSALVERFGWATMGDQVRIRCFTHDPSIPSSLKFLRRTPWARAKVEQMYLDMVRERRD
jgi:hypothetical protein